MSQTRDQSYSAKHRLSKSGDFKMVFSRGRRTSTGTFVLFTYPNRLSVSRLGVQVKAKIGTAARRNYIKRIVREAFRRLKVELSQSIDIIFIAKAGMATVRFRELETEFRRCLERYLSA